MGSLPTRERSPFSDAPDTVASMGRDEFKPAIKIRPLDRSRVPKEIYEVLMNVRECEIDGVPLSEHLANTRFYEVKSRS